MGDVAHILGVKDGPPPVPAGAAAAGRSSRALQLQALPKEVADLIGTTTKEGGAAELPPQVPASGYAPPPKLSSTGAAAAAQAPPDTTTTTKKQDGAEDVLVKVGNKFISSAKPCRKWVWAPFSSSSRTDGLLLHHWVRANVEYPDYPYSRFDIHLDPVAYSNDDEYDKHLKDRDWSKSETDQLLQLARIYELRWPIIYDRWMEHFGYTNRACGGTNNSSSEATDQATTAANTDAPKRRKIEDLQHRYYSVAAILMQTRISHEAAAEAQALASQTAATAAAAATADPTAEDHKRATDALLIETAAARALASADPKHQPVLHNLGSGTSNRVAFDLNYERERRSHMEALWSRTKEEEHEEAELRKELKQVEAQLRKLKKSGAHILAAGGGRGGGAAAAAAGASTSLVSSAASSRAATPVAIGGIAGSSASALDPTTVPSLLEQAFASTAPVAVSGTPYLQSARLVGPSAGGAAGINKTLLNRMDEVLDELDIPEAPLPTKRVCDLYDAVRKDVLTLLILQKTVLQEEGGLESKRLKLAKRSGNARVIDEETLLGIAPPQPQTPAVQSSSSAVRSGSLSKSARGTGGKGSKGGSAGKSKSKVDSSGKSSSSKAGGDGKLPASGAGAVKQAPASANAGGKQAPGGKQALGGKQARKGSTTTKKRKRKANTPSNAAALTASAAAAAAATAAGAGGTKAASRPPAP